MSDPQPPLLPEPEREPVDWRGSMTAAELMAKLEADPDFVRRRSEREAAMQERVNAWREAERPLVDDLRGVGIHVESAWELVNTSEPYPLALPILMMHLERGGYPDRVLEGVARALAVPPSSICWFRLRDLHPKAVGPDERGGIAVAMAASATSDHFEALIDVIGDPSWGSNRIFFLETALRVGG